LARDRVVPARVQLAPEPERLADRKAVGQRVLLRDETETREQLAGLVLRRAPEHEHAAGARPQQADGELEQRRLAGTVGTYQRGHRALGDPERALAQGPLCAVALAQPFGLKRTHATLETLGGRTTSANRPCMFSSSHPAARAAATHFPRPARSALISSGGSGAAASATNVPTPRRPSVSP